MSAFRVAPSSPFFILGAAVVAFVAWLTYDATQAPGSHMTHPPASNASRVLRDIPAASQIATAGPLEVQLTALHPGVARLVAEQQLSTLPGPEVDPVDVSSGHPVFRERYSIRLDQPVTLLSIPEEEFTPGPYVLTVEFDGAVAGHPLTRISLDPAIVP